ncbi:hypothetical protein JW758_05570 [Candidatus Peregrinibacteria bacterium]|nr:hypothetical protein [Candidatus Peregrinibacteria bacterium]
MTKSCKRSKESCLYNSTTLATFAYTKGVEEGDELRDQITDALKKAQVDLSGLEICVKSKCPFLSGLIKEVRRIHKENLLDEA